MTTTDIATPTTAELDAAITTLAEGATRWATLTPRRRAAVLRETQRAIAAEAGVWTGTATAAKQVPSGSYEGEEWMSGPAASAPMLAEYAATLEKLGSGASALQGVKLGSAPGGRIAVRVLPGDAKDLVLFSGYTADVWLKPGVTEDQARRDAGLDAGKLDQAGGVGLVLGAGNISSIGPLDVVYELVAYNRASILKLNPTFAHLKPSYDRALAPLVERDLVRIVNGGAEVGGYLAGHPDIVHVHITGSARTHDAIVWGPGAEGEANKQAGTPKLHKEMTSELGGVSPIIVIPGDWSKRDLRFQAEHVVTQRLHNAGHNCIGGQALVISRDWAQKDAFLAEIRAVLTSIQARPPWYPGGADRIAHAQQTYPAAEQVGSALLVPMTEGAPTELYDGEYFAAVLGITELPGTGAEFFANAAAFANDTLDGTLGASIIVHPRDRRAMGERFDEVVASLRYGALGINVWSGIVFLLGGAAWGAYPGHTLDAVGSGIGVVHNTHLLADTEKTVATGPFREFPRSLLAGEVSLAPKPPWFVTARTAAKSGKALARLGGKRSWRNTLRVVPPAMRG
ncbi:MAG TPA: aldehyde dehydrogenase family protein [Nocardioides sp.]|nr:aldehyde dehydrogenase family protein [Nocardioides sp.]